MSKLKTTAVLTSAAIGLGLMSATAFAGKITFVSWGGSYTASQVKACIEPYEAKTGQQFNVVDYNGGLAEIRTQVEAGNVQWDIVDTTPQDALRGCDEGLLVELDPHSGCRPPMAHPPPRISSTVHLATAMWVTSLGPPYLPITERPSQRLKA